MNSQLSRSAAELLARRPDKNEEDFFATRIIRAAREAGQFDPDGDSRQTKWMTALLILKRYLKTKLNLNAPYIRATAFDGIDSALAEFRCSAVPEGFDCAVQLVRLPDNRLTMLSFGEPCRTMPEKYGLPITLHQGIDPLHVIVQQPMSSVLAAIGGSHCE